MDVDDPSGWKWLYPGISQDCLKALIPRIKKLFQIDASKSEKSNPDKSKPEKKARVKRQKEGLLRKGQKVRIYPTKDQETLLTQWIGSGRYLWNMALAKQSEYMKFTKNTSPRQSFPRKPLF